MILIQQAVQDCLSKHLFKLDKSLATDLWENNVLPVFFMGGEITAIGNRRFDQIDKPSDWIEVIKVNRIRCQIMHSYTPAPEIHNTLNRLTLELFRQIKCDYIAPGKQFKFLGSIYIKDCPALTVPQNKISSIRFNLLIDGTVWEYNTVDT